MNEQIWSWIVTLVGISGFFITSNKIWWGWYINLGCQGLWITYALISHQPAFLISAGLYSVVFGRAAIKWTREHFNADAVDRAAMLKASIMTTNEAREKGYMDSISMEFKKQARIIHERAREEAHKTQERAAVSMEFKKQARIIHEGPEFDPDVMRKYPDHEHVIVKNYNPPLMSVDQQHRMTKTQERAAVLDWIDDFDIYRNRIAIPNLFEHRCKYRLKTVKDYVYWFHCEKECGNTYKVDKFALRRLILGEQFNIFKKGSWEGGWWKQVGSA